MLAGGRWARKPNHGAESLRAPRSAAIAVPATPAATSGDIRRLGRVDGNRRSGREDDLQRFATVVDRVGLAGLVERHAVGDERRRVELAGGEQRQDAVEVGDHVGEAEPQLQPLQPGEADRHLGIARVGADAGDRAGVPGEADRQRRRRRVADRVDDDVGAQLTGRRPKVPLRVGLGQMQRRRPELRRHRQPLLDAVDREDRDRAAGQSGLHGAQPDRPEAEHGHRVTGPHPCVGDRVVARPHHVAGEEGGIGRHPRGHPAQAEVRVRHQQLLRLGALQIAELAAVTEDAATPAAVVIAAHAGGAGRAGRVKGPQHPVPRPDPLDRLPRRHHRPHELVPDREPGLHRHPPMKDVQIRPADPSSLHPHHRIVSGNQLRLRLLLHPHLAGCLKRHSPHGGTVQPELRAQDPLPEPRPPQTFTPAT